MYSELLKNELNKTFNDLGGILSTNGLLKNTAELFLLHLKSQHNEAAFKERGFAFKTDATEVARATVP